MTTMLRHVFSVRPHGLCFGLMLCLALCSARVLAQPDDPPASTPEAASTPDGTAAEAGAEARASDEARSAALAKFKQGSLAFQQRRYKDAIDLFLAADRMVKNPAFAYNTALAYEQMGDSAQALRWCREYLRRAPGAPDRARAEQRIVRLEGALAKKGVQQVTVLSLPDGATVLIDGRAVGVTPWTGEMTPGGHELQLQLRGYQDQSTRFELAPHRAMDLRLALEPTPEAKSSRRPLPRFGSDDSSTPSDEAPSVGAHTWVVLGVGVAGLGASLVFELVRAGAEEDARTAPTQVEAAGHVDRMEDYQLAARVLVGVGAAATLAGAVLLAIDLWPADQDTGAEPPPEVAVGLGCQGCSAGLSATGRF